MMQVLDAKDSLDTEESRNDLLMQKLLYEAPAPASQALIKKEITIEPFPQVYSGMLKNQPAQQSRTGNIIQTSLDMDWESPSEFLNSGLTAGPSFPQILVKEDRDVSERDGDENCSAGHLDHRDHTYACMAQAKGKSGIKQEKKKVQESNLETASMRSSWCQPIYTPAMIFATTNVSHIFGQAEGYEKVKVSHLIFIFKYFSIDF